MKKNLAMAAVFFALAANPAMSEVADSSSNGFTVKVTLHIKAAPADVYGRFLRNVGDWWSSQHTYSGSSHNLSIEEKAMGCFCEKLPDGGAVRHMEVVILKPGKAVSLTGALGPLQSIAATGNMEIRFSPAESGTRLEVTYAVTGYFPAGLNTWAAPVDAVLTEQLTQLKNYIEQGDPAPKQGRD
jgi:uncharacterized protein YndB with AHSA1/START domain